MSLQWLTARMRLIRDSTGIISKVSLSFGPATDWTTCVEKMSRLFRILRICGGNPWQKEAAHWKAPCEWETRQVFLLKFRNMHVQSFLLVRAGWWRCTWRIKISSGDRYHRCGFASRTWISPRGFSSMSWENVSLVENVDNLFCIGALDSPWLH